MKKPTYAFVLLLMALTMLMFSCDMQHSKVNEKSFSIDYEKYILPNGLEVILHEDHSDPVVAVAILVHVGSSREKIGRTGFAHFFEHMLFQRSENVPEGFFFKKIGEWGGDFNGGTFEDGTIYYETVPKDALEKVLWMESDRMGYFINAVSLKNLEGEKPVVQNEKRQRVDNQPYGYTNSVIKKALYPEGHPYSWTVIGELEDLQNATLDDVKDFYEKWYGPNNATLVIAGDINKEEVKAMIEKYFGEIPSRGGKKSKKMVPQPVSLTETKILNYEDNFASLPEISITYPTVDQVHPDKWALDALGKILSSGKRAPLYKSIVEEAQLAPDVSAYHQTLEIAGTFTIAITANENVPLDSVYDVVEKSLKKFNEESFDIRDLERIKTTSETSFYNDISSVMEKAFQLAFSNEYGGDPSFIETNIANIKAVTKEDVMRVFRKYILGKNKVITCFVPKGSIDLAMKEGEIASVKEEAITPYQPTNLPDGEEPEIKKTTASFDRTQEPPFGKDKPLVTPPTIWQDELSNKLKIYGVVNNELPLVNFSLIIRGGLSVDDPAKVGVANLITDMMMEGTAQKTPEELEDAIGQLGANLSMYTSDEYIHIGGNCLSRNFDSLMAIFSEVVTEPRWDEKEFERVVSLTINNIKARDTDPFSIAQMVMKKKVLGNRHILSNPSLGYEKTIQEIMLDDLKSYYAEHFLPNISMFHVVGDVSKKQVKKALATLEHTWSVKERKEPATSYIVKETPKKLETYFVDIPGAKQSVILFNRLTVSPNSPDYNNISIANSRLGQGSFGKLFAIMREEKQFTYGAYSYPRRMVTIPSKFFAASSVQSNVTPEAFKVFKHIISSYGETFTEEDLEQTQSRLIRSNANRFETQDKLLITLENISTYNLPLDYVDQMQKAVTTSTVLKVKNTAKEYFNLDNFICVIVGDKATQYRNLKKEGTFKLTDRYGKNL